MMGSSSSMSLIFLMTLAYCVCASARQSAPERLGPITTQATSEPQRFRMQVDYGFLDGNSCGQFFRASMPSQSRPPVSAYTSSFRAAIKDAIAYANISARAERVAIFCDNPPAPLDRSRFMKRVRLVAYLSPMTLAELAGTYCEQHCDGPGEELGLIPSYVAREGNFLDAVNAQLDAAGQQMFAPKIFDYNIPGKTVICASNSYCLKKWNPRRLRVYN